MTQPDLKAEALVRRCLSGEPKAWDDLVDRYARLVYSIPRRYGLDDSACDDVMQAVFVAAFQHLSRLSDAGRLPSWLITTAHRESWRVARSRPAMREGSVPIEERIADVGAPVEEDADRWDRQDRVHRALVELGGRCEELLRALYFQRNEARYEVIAVQLDMPIGSIGPTRARCLQKLGRVLREQGLDWDVEPGEPRAAPGRSQTVPAEGKPPASRR